MERFRRTREDILKRREEKRKLKEEMHRYRMEMHRQQEEFHRRFRQLNRHKPEFQHYQRHIRFTRPLIVIFNLLIWYWIFRHVGIKAISVSLAILVSLGGMYEFFFLRRIQNRILEPISKLKNGVEEIAKGNYNVKIESDVTNEIKLLVDSFNIMTEKLRESEQIKAEYEENRKMLIANISHDLKTPITSIQGYIEAITEGNPVSQKDFNKYLKIIHNNASYINKLVDDLFLFSKLDMQKLDFNMSENQVGPFFDDIMEEFKYEFEDKQFQFVYTNKLESSCNVRIDRKRIHQVLRNIIGNAVKYVPEQSLAVNAELYKKGQCVYIDIKDNGPGISADKLPHIFDRFFRIDHERTKDFMSTGLGLAISKELVEAHGGEISVTSVVNEGTCFTIKLPIAEPISD